MAFVDLQSEIDSVVQQVEFNLQRWSAYEEQEITDKVSTFFKPDFTAYSIEAIK